MQAVSVTGGLVKIGGDVWSARSTDGVLEPGSTVIVTRIDGATAVVASGAEENRH
jgi:membrane protein implicated in regulation of membrane protease activity